MTFQLTSEQARVMDIIEGTREHVFVTGRAGTGKSTLLQEFVERTKKSLVIAAPTGVAALTVGGQTIHSLFRLPIGLVTDHTKFYPLSDDARVLLRKIDTVVIDEISMVRCDLLDGLDRRLRATRGRRNEPFGGVQVVMFGDPYQLPPVLKDGPEKHYLMDNYSSPWFFDSKVWKEVTPRVVELTDVKRQDEAEFREILDRMRNGAMTSTDGAALNDIGARRPIPEGTVTLSTTNASANSINAKALRDLPGKSVTAAAIIEGDFGGQLPAEEELELKPGARVMFLRNDSAIEGSRWVNGTVGTVVKIDAAVHVALDSDPRNTVEVQPVQWEKIQYTYDPDTNRVEEDIMATFAQFPLRLAWAVTIHKSQGQTLDSAVLDFGRGAFANGQAYVAFSRIRTLDGVYLSRTLQPSDIQVDRRVVDFMRTAKDNDFLE
ncbi:MAG: AAA family ATPase [Microbacteriaceae bacterium]|nr:AAA family ATPase [Microbacteriaceae bacterium]